MIERGSNLLITTPGTGFFVQIPDGSNERILHAALLEDVEGSSYTAQVKEDEAPLKGGQSIFIFYELKGEFVRQPASTSALSHTPAGINFAFEFTGEPVSAERRQCYRVSTVLAAVTATFGDEENCAVLDVSATGFAVLAEKQRKVGDVVDTIVRSGNENFSGPVRIESVRESNCGRFRYGLHCLDAMSEGKALRNGLQKISATVQREHLRRLSRAG